MKPISPTAVVEALRASLLDVLNGCPADLCNPSDCPLYGLRALDYPRRLQWLDALGQSDLEYLAVYHFACLRIKLHSRATPATEYSAPAGCN